MAGEVTLSSTFRMNRCAGAPAVQYSITGYVEGATFEPVSKDDYGFVGSTTRVFRPST